MTFLPSTIPALGASLIHPWGFMQSYCCGVKQKTQNKLKESLPIVPLVDSSLTDCKTTATKEISTEELYQELKSLKILLREYIIDIRYLQNDENRIDHNDTFTCTSQKFP